jgi:type I site-specific restriction-modification system R (restriction) subunit
VDSVGLLKYLRESLRKYELIAEGDIVADLERNLLSRVEERFEEFKRNLKDIKEFLKSLRIEGRELGIDVDHLKEAIKIDKRAALEAVNELNKRLRIIAAFWDKVEVQRALSLMSEVIQQFRALGSHRGKMHYVIDVGAIVYIYGNLLNHIKGERLPEQFWEGLIEMIHEKTLVEDFKKVISTVVTNDDLSRLLSKLRKIKASELIPEREIADAYTILRILLEGLPQNPVYKEIRERIERARRNWIARNIDTVTFLDLLTNSIEDKLGYDVKVASMTDTDRITETVKLLITQKYTINEGAQLQLANFKKALSETIEAPRMVTTHIRYIRTALMKDLFMELREQGIKISELKRLSEDVVEDYILNELTRLKRR